jgi:hypothetical protein
VFFDIFRVTYVPIAIIILALIDERLKRSFRRLQASELVVMRIDAEVGNRPSRRSKASLTRVKCSR